jgi:DNA polymerase
LWKPATQAVFGTGPVPAHLVFVGEQPGDKEDIAGKPFVGPAGRLLDRALAQAGIACDKAYVTNAVKHFKFVPRGKIRLHQKPSSVKSKACRAWLEKERKIVKPKLIIAMGATAVESVFGKALPVGRNRGRIAALDDDSQVLVAIHPSYILRME